MTTTYEQAYERMSEMKFNDLEMEFIFADWANQDEHFDWLMTASRDEISSWIDPEFIAQGQRRQAAAILGRKGGSARTPAKRAASANNGRKGGRPRKTQA